LSAGQKARFEKKYKAEMEKFNKKMDKYKTTKEWAAFQKKKEQHKLDTVKKAKFKKDENAPTRPQSAYLLFTADERDDLVASGMSHKEAMVEMGKKWGKLSAAKKKMYEDKAAALKAKYTKQEEKDENKPSAKYDKQVEDYKKTATHKKYQAEQDEFYAQKMADLKKLKAEREEFYAQKKADLKKLEAQLDLAFDQLYRKVACTICCGMHCHNDDNDDDNRCLRATHSRSLCTSAATVRYSRLHCNAGCQAIGGAARCRDNSK